MDKTVVARLIDGRLYKGVTEDFHPNKEEFTVQVTEGPWTGRKISVRLNTLKALFFVRSLRGNRNYRENKLLIPKSPLGHHVLITFPDGESMRGTTMGLNLNTRGFYLFPSDPNSNNKRIFVVRDSIKSIKIEKEEKRRVGHYEPGRRRHAAPPEAGG